MQPQPPRRPSLALLAAVMVTAVMALPARPGVDYTPSRVSTFERKVSLAGKTERDQDAKVRTEKKTRVDAARREEDERIAKRYEEFEKATHLTEEERELFRRSLEKEKEGIEAARKKKGLDPLFEMRKRKALGKLDHDVELEVPSSDQEEQVANLAEIHSDHKLAQYFSKQDNAVALLVVEEDCDRCEEAKRIFEEVTAIVGEDEYHMPRQHRHHRFAFLNASEAPERYVELQEHAAHIDTEMYHFPVTMWIAKDVNEGTKTPPHYITFRTPQQYRSDLLHTFRRVQNLRRHARFRNEDELMRCVHETHGDGVTFTLLLDAAHREHHLMLERSIAHVLKRHIHDAQVCQYHSDIRPEEQGRVAPPDEEFHSRYNPERAHVAAFFADADDEDTFTADYFTFARGLINTTTPDKALAALETQRFNRWVQRALLRRHHHTGRRFNNLKQRMQVTSHGQESCHDSAKRGDSIVASIRATSVDHGQVFFETDGPQSYVAGDAIPGLPPYLHDVLVGACRNSRFEVYSPHKEGFQAELVEVNVTDVRPPSQGEPERFYQPNREIHHPSSIDPLSAAAEEDL
jgi:hypothetical protein